MALLIEHPEDLKQEIQKPEEQLCRDFFDDVWARGNTDRVDRYLDDHFYWNASPGYSNDRAGYANMVDDFHKAFPDLQADLEAVAAGDGCVGAQWCVEGHQDGKWMGVAPTGKQIRMEGLVMENVKDNRIQSEFIAMDTAQMMLKLGVTDLSKLG